METVHGSASFGFRPSESYLAGKKKGKKDETSKEEGDERKKADQKSVKMEIVKKGPQ